MRSVLIISLIATLAVFRSALGGSLPFSRPGLIDIPTATIIQHTQVVLGGSFTAFSYEKADSTSESDFAIGGHLDIGLFDRGQIGVTWLGDAGISGNARVIIFKERINLPAIAIGCQNIIGEKNYEFFSDEQDSLYNYEKSQNFSAYLVLTKNLDFSAGMPLSIHVGYGIGRFLQGKSSDSDGISNPFRGLFVGFDYHPVRNFSMMLEWDGRDANLGATYTLNRNVRFSGAVAEIEQLAISNRDQSDVMQNVKISLGVEITLGPLFNRTTLEPFEELTQNYDSELLYELEKIRSTAEEDINQMKREIH